jgi:arabinose-5-phosphate isomerase
MGKSGLVGRKIASTLASTGSPAFFLHPGEASHGDLGMITKKDIILALSNSGETQELADVIAYSCRYGVPLVSITQGAKSALAQESDLTLLLPPLPEACPNGLAPTTSTTMMMALGDALAVCLLKRRSFSKEDFKALHPGGRLGTRLRRVKELMHTDRKLPLITHGTLMSDALIEMTSKSFGCVGIVDEKGLLMGIITDGDLRRHMSGHLLQQPVDSIMTTSPKTISPEMLLEEALHIMEGKVTVLFIVDDHKKPIGLLHIHDLLRIGMV